MFTPYKDRKEPFDFDDPSLYSTVNEEQIECADYAYSDQLLTSRIRQGTIGIELLPFTGDDQKRDERIAKQRAAEQAKQEKWERECEERRAQLDELRKRQERHARESHVHYWVIWRSHRLFDADSPANPVICLCGAEGVLFDDDGEVTVTQTGGTSLFPAGLTP